MGDQSSSMIIVFQPEWYGSVPSSTQGRDNHPGALRTSRTVAPGGTRTITEEAGLSTFLKMSPDSLRFAPIVISVWFRPQRLFHPAIQAAHFIPYAAIQLVQWPHCRLLGHAREFVDLQIWNSDTVERVRLLDGAPIGYVHYPYPHPTEEAVLCHLFFRRSGRRHADVEARFADYAEFHETALTNATQVLQKQGKVLGTNLKPVSIQSFWVWEFESYDEACDVERRAPDLSARFHRGGCSR